jgi:hypothetical protein
MKEYFKIIRKALSESRGKNQGIYYESHHIIPKSFNKQSKTVLLTPEEHYIVHKLLAEYWKDHFLYGKKMLWAFHRLSYDNKRKISKEEYGEARRILQKLWKSEKTITHKEKISISMKGNTNNSTRVFKGMKSDLTQEGKNKISRSITLYQTGKTGIESKAGKGEVIYENIKGEIIQAGSCLQLSYLVSICQSSLAYRLKNNPGKIIRGYSIKYKSSI